MLIRSTSRSSDRDSVSRVHGAKQSVRDEVQYRLQRGIAKVALEAKAEGKTLTDSGGRPFHYANGAANFGFRELESRLGGRRNRVVVGDPKATGTKRVPWEWETK